MDEEKGDTVLEHLKQAVRYMYSQVGTHGLCLFLDGDWTDPINGAGRGGKGESVWNSMTGSNAWLLWVMLQYILGIKTTVDGIHTDSHLPQRLQGTKVSRKYRGEIHYFSLI